VQLSLNYDTLLNNYFRHLCIGILAVAVHKTRRIESRNSETRCRDINDVSECTRKSEDTT
jgi:hypothetical protein